MLHLHVVFFFKVMSWLGMDISNWDFLVGVFMWVRDSLLHAHAFQGQGSMTLEDIGVGECVWIQKFEAYPKKKLCICACHKPLDMALHWVDKSATIPKYHSQICYHQRAQ